jgi:hypothetical protein
MDAHFTSKADIEGTQTDVCFVPITNIRQQKNVQDRPPEACTGQQTSLTLEPVMHMQVFPLPLPYVAPRSSDRFPCRC